MAHLEGVDAAVRLRLLDDTRHIVRVDRGRVHHRPRDLRLLRCGAEQCGDGEPPLPHVVNKQLRERLRTGLDRMSRVFGRFAVLAFDKTSRNDEEFHRLVLANLFHEIPRQSVHVHVVTIQFLRQFAHRIAVASKAHAI